MKSTRTLIFISHRWSDTKSEAELLADALRKNFPSNTVFVDSHQIQAGEPLDKRILDALQHTRVMLVLIGAQWYGRAPNQTRRIDAKDDWVRREIAHALSKPEEIRVIPIIVGQETAKIADLIGPSADLQPDIRGIGKLTWMPFRVVRADSAAIVDRLSSSEFAFSRAGQEIYYPRPVDKTPALSKSDLTHAMKSLPEWKIVEGENPSRPSHGRSRGRFTLRLLRRLSTSCSLQGDTASSRRGIPAG